MPSYMAIETKALRHVIRTHAGESRTANKKYVGNFERETAANGHWYGLHIMLFILWSYGPPFSMLWAAWHHARTLERRLEPLLVAIRDSMLSFSRFTRLSNLLGDLHSNLFHSTTFWLNLLHSALFYSILSKTTLFHSLPLCSNPFLSTPKQSQANCVISRLHSWQTLAF